MKKKTETQEAMEAFKKWFEDQKEKMRQGKLDARTVQNLSVIEAICTGVGIL